MTGMRLIRVFHLDASGRAERVAALETAGYEVDASTLDAAGLRALTERLPAAVLIDLSRAPSQGRDVGLFLRKTAATRRLPLVFIAGEEEKTARVRALLPDAVYTSWPRVRSALKQAIARPPAEPVVPASALAGYSGTPLWKKLGIKPGSVVVLLNAPAEFESSLGELPEGVRFRRQARGNCDLVVWFCERARELERRVERLGAFAGRGGLWIAWPKQASGCATDLTQAEVRRVGLASGLVDYKICAIDAIWSGLRFARRAPSLNRAGK